MKPSIRFFSNTFLKVPNEIMIEVTDSCNLDCGFCFNKLYVERRNNKRALNTDSIKRIIDKIIDANVPVIRFTGGEPLLRPDIFALMNYARKGGLRVWLNTNATLIDKEVADKVAEYVENVLVPLNAYDGESAKLVTGANYFKRKLRGVILLQNKGIKTLRCGTVATKANISQLEKIHALVRRLNIADWEIFRPIPLSRDKLPVDNNDMALLVEKLSAINMKTRKRYRIANAIPFCCYDSRKVERVALGAIADDGHSRFVIDTRGNAKPMYYLKEHIGNIFHDDIIDIWNHGFMKDMRRLNYVPEICKKCRYLKRCKGGSRITSKIVLGDYRGIDYLARPARHR